MTDPSSHFADESWADFVRDVASPEVTASIRRHLHDECETCRSAWTAWQHVFATLTRDCQFEPSPAAVRSVKAAFSRKKRVLLLDRMIESARLIFDSYLEPAAAGVRGGGFAATRHLIHEAGKYLVNVQIEPAGAGARWLAGQITGDADGAGDIDGTAVMLMRGEDEVLQLAAASCTGEFHMEFDVRDDLTLFLETRSSRLIAIRLPDLEGSAVLPSTSDG